MIHPVILCGGNGTRLWPRSRASMPKPFLPLLGTRSLFECTLDRCNDSAIFASPIVVTGADHLPHVEAQARDIDGASIIVEPMGRNTAPAIALAAMRLTEDAVMLVCPSDHHIEDAAAFVAAAENAASLAAKDWLVSFGITPTRPETGYGYINRGDAVGAGYAVKQFVEKPDLARAQQFLDEGSYSWNGGIFAFRAGALVGELKRHRPDMYEKLRQSVDEGAEEQGKFYPAARSFAGIAGEFIDYAVMENTQQAAMVPVSMGWSDIGNWDALHDARGGDEDGNHAIGRAELLQCRNVMVESDGARVSAIGLENVIIVVDGDEVLVTSADGAQLVGKLKGASDQ